MSTRFNTKQGLIIVQAHIWGPTGDTFARLALDTGATATMVNTDVLVSVGYDPAASAKRTWMTTGSGVEFVPRLPLKKIEARRSRFAVVAHTLPPSASGDGVLGLDFCRDLELTINFRKGVVILK